MAGPIYKSIRHTSPGVKPLAGGCLCTFTYTTKYIATPATTGSCEWVRLVRPGRASGLIPDSGGMSGRVRNGMGALGWGVWGMGKDGLGGHHTLTRTHTKAVWSAPMQRDRIGHATRCVRGTPHTLTRTHTKAVWSAPMQSDRIGHAMRRSISSLCRGFHNPPIRSPPPFSPQFPPTSPLGKGTPGQHKPKTLNRSAPT